MQAERLGHALLLTGPAGVGKRRFAERIAATLLCAAADTERGADGGPCGQCEDCRLLVAGNHPDLVRLVPDADSKTHEIKAEAVRDLCASQSMTTSRGRRAVFCIAPAEAMTTTAANGLLKTLEEPNPATLMLLVSEAPGRLPATIRSRCQRLVFGVPAAAEAASWLRARAPASSDVARLLGIAHGAPLRALALASDDVLERREGCLQALGRVAAGKQDPLAVAQAWQALDPALVLDWLAGWVSDALRLRTDPNAGYLVNPDQRGSLAQLAAGLSPQAAHRYLLQVYAARAEASSTVNKLLLFEALLLGWASLTTGRAAILL
jgi:DNA polymerase-3 subunit delta'